MRGKLNLWFLNFDIFQMFNRTFDEHLNGTTVECFYISTAPKNDQEKVDTLKEEIPF